MATALAELKRALLKANVAARAATDAPTTSRLEILRDADGKLAGLVGDEIVATLMRDGDGRATEIVVTG